MANGILQHDAASRAGGAAGRNERIVQVSPNDDWLTGVVHDLNNELAILKGQLDLLRRQTDHAGGMERAHLCQSLSPMDTATRKLIRLTGGLLDLHSFQTGQALSPERRRSDLVALARQVVAERQQVSAWHDLHLETEEAIIGWWDAAELERVLDNLLGNAVKYSPCGGAVTVRLTREIDRGEDWAVLTVRDAGLGIAPADLPHIFQPRYRAASVAGKQSGSGMGLAIVRQIVKAHGGTVTAESRLGHGSTFAVRLPLAASV